MSPPAPPHWPTIRDLAAAAGVGTASVDRVLNGRPGVSPAMRRRILEAARRIGFDLPPAVADTGPALPEVALGFVLHKRSQEFYQRFAARIEEACAAVPGARVTARIDFAAGQTPEAFREGLERAAEQGRVVAATAINHPVLTRTVETLAGRGVAVLSLLNDFAGPAGAGHFGLDDLRAGRIAGWMMARLCPGRSRVGLFIGGNRWHGQGLREAGFRSAMRQHAPKVVLGDAAVNLETRQVTYEATIDLLDRHPDLAGLYVAGGGMEGAIAALRERRPPNRIALVVNELTRESRNALVDGYATMVMATPLDELCRALVGSMVALATDSDAPLRPVEPFEPRLYLPDSV